MSAADKIRRLEFRPECSRPIWRNIHTGREATILDIGVDQQGGFQGGCRRFTVTTDDPLPPGPPALHRYRGHVYSLWSFIEHWEPTGRYADAAEVEDDRDGPQEFA